MRKTIERFKIDEVYYEALRFIGENEKNLEELSDYTTSLKDEDIDSSFRVKSKYSYVHKWNSKLGKSMRLIEVCNDFIAIRMILNKDRKEINEFIDKCLEKNRGYTIHKVDMYNKTKAYDDGYRGIHLYFKNNSRCFPIEVQIWNKEDAILNFFTHEYIYKNKRTEKVDFSYYGYRLRQWLDNIPRETESIKKDYIAYLYEKICCE